MSFTAQELEEFKTEALELLDLGEKSLLAADGGADFRSCFDAVFRSLHNLKGASGMMDLSSLQAHTHELESILMQFKEQSSMPKSYISMFLRGIDGARSILDGKQIHFVYLVDDVDPAVNVASSQPTLPQEAQEIEAVPPETSISNEKIEISVSESSAGSTTSNTVAQSSQDEFISECEEIIERFTALLRLIESSKHTRETYDEAYREMHSLKGTAYLFGYSEMGDVAHAMESALEPIRDGTHKLSKLLMDGLYKAIECVEIDLSFAKKGLPNDKVKALVPMIKRILAGASSQLVVEKIEPSPSLTHTAEVVPSVEITAASAAIQASPSPAAPPIASSSSATAETDHSASSTPSNKENDSGTSIRVPVALLDNLMTLMGEMVLVRNQVLQFSNKSEDLDFLNLSQRLNVVTSEIQGEMMKTRMQPIGNVLNKFHRVVRDLSQELKKNISLTLSGAETELDKSLLEAIKDPLTHIVRNSCDHGVETIEARRAVGKPDAGSIVVKSYHEGGQVVIEVTDDGKGLHKTTLIKKAIEKGLITEVQSAQMSEKEVFNLIFAPGFSTAAKVTNVSGRGVGMDVVRTNIEKIGGTVDISSESGKGTTIRLKIPLTLAIVPALIVHGANGTFAIPQVKLIELVRVDQSSDNKIEYLQGAPVLRLRGDILPMIDLNQVLGSGKRAFQPDAIINIAVLNAESHAFGLIVDEIEDTADIVVKPLNRLLKSLHVYSGATILGDGSVALILDVQGIAKVANLKNESNESGRGAGSRTEAAVLGANELQDFLLVRLNSPAKHAIVLSYVNRLEEFKRSDIEVSGNQRVIRYRQAVLPIISANHHLQYGSASNELSDIINVVVIERAGHLFAIEVDEILDTLSTTAELDTALATHPGIIGNLNTDQELVVVIDPYQLVSSAFPNINQPSHQQAAVVGHQRPSDKKESLRTVSKRVLLVEDSVFFRRLIKSTLEDAGHEVVTASDGLEAVEILNGIDRPFDLIVSDIEMPRMNGFKLAVAIRSNARHSRTPLIALSSKNDRRHVAEGLKAGFDLYLEKLKPEALLQGVAEVTSGAIGRAS